MFRETVVFKLPCMTTIVSEDGEIEDFLPLKQVVLHTDDSNIVITSL